MNTFKRIYRLPYRPLVVRDLLAECDIAQYEAAEAVGVNKETLRLAVNRGYIPGYKKDFRQRVERFIIANALAMAWLRTRRISPKEIWNPIGARFITPEKGRRPADHGRRVYRSRIDNIPAKYGAYTSSQKITRLQKERRKAFMENGYATLAQFGYRDDPFKPVRIRTGDDTILRRIFQMAVNSRAIFSVVAPWGAGKTTSIEMAAAETDANIIRIITADTERIKVHDIERTILRQLRPSEPIARDRDTRAHQLRRVMGEAGKEKAVILIIEEAHCLHHSTLRALKRIREYEWMGQRPLLSIILVGQYDKLKSGNLEELRLGTRSDTYRLRGLAPSESARYITETVGENFEEEATHAIKELPVARNFLELQEALITLMSAALGRGTKTVTVLDVFEVYGGGLKQLMEKYDIKLSQLCEASGIDKTTVSLIINNRTNTLSKDNETSSRDAIHAALRNMIPSKEKRLKAVGDGQ